MTDGENGADPADDDGSGPEAGAITPERDALLLDAMLGRLASRLRVCGYDTAYTLDEGIEADDAIRERAAADGRRLLTRDRDLAAATPGAILLTARDVGDQLAELREAGVELTPADRPVRCGACNGRLERLEPGESRPSYAPEDGPLWRCVECGQCFWMGSHWDELVETLDRPDATDERTDATGR